MNPACEQQPGRTNRPEIFFFILADLTSMNTLLIVPDQVHAKISDLPNVTTTPFPTSFIRSVWPAAVGVLPMVDGFARVVATQNSDLQAVREMTCVLSAIDDSASSAIVFADETIPAALRATIPECLHPFLRRPHCGDLIAISTTTLRSADARSSMLDIAMAAGMSHAALAKHPHINRFPMPGPGSSEVSVDSLQPAIEHAVDGLKLSSMERRCTEAGLLLLWDFLDESHEISQTMEGKGSPRTADYWHGIMHRREPDAGNASYWFRRVGHHPAFDVLGTSLEDLMLQLGATADQSLQAKNRLIKRSIFDPFAMIELSQSALRSPTSPDHSLCRMVQYIEILNLIAWSTNSK